MHGRKADEARHAFSRADRVRAVQFLTAELALGEGGLLPGGEHSIWSSYEAHAAAATLTQYLREQMQTQ
jgi:hypothetical protein